MAKTVPQLGDAGWSRATALVQPGLLPSELTRLTVSACASDSCCRPAPIRCAALRFAARPAACPSTPDPRVNVLPVSRKARPSCGSRLVPLHGTVLTRCKHRLAPYRRPQTHPHPLKATASPRLRRGPGEVA